MTEEEKKPLYKPGKLGVQVNYEDGEHGPELNGLELMLTDESDHERYLSTFSCPHTIGRRCWQKKITTSGYVERKLPGGNYGVSLSWNEKDYQQNITVDGDIYMEIHVARDGKKTFLPTGTTYKPRP